MRPTARQLVALAAGAGFIAAIVAANWALKTLGFVPVGFGLLAPAGVYFVGLTFTFRDVLQNTVGRWWVLPAIVVGAAVSYLIAPSFAVASGVTFLCSELADWAVYTPLYRRGWLTALVPANLAGLVVDSAVFLWLAFGSLAHVQGLILGKAYLTAIAVLLLWPVRRRYALRPA